MVISRTPVRLSFFGGGTDYREYFERSKGAVLGTTIDKYTYVSLNKLSDFFEYKIRVGYSKTELVNTPDKIVHPHVREVLKFKYMEGNLDIHIFSDLPAKSGLGSSSSTTVGLLNALYALEGKKISKKRLADETIHIEHHMVHENIGCQDQVHAAFGGLNVIEFGKGEINVRPVIISKEKYSLLNDSMLVFFTGLTRHASEIVVEQIENTKAMDKDDYLKRMYQMVFDAETVISDNTPEEMIESLGGLLNEGWQLKKQLSSKISNGFIDEMYKKAIDAGAYGGKLAGAGGGGFLFFLAPKDAHPSIRIAMKGLLEVNFNFESEGSKIIYLTP